MLMKLTQGFVLLSTTLLMYKITYLCTRRPLSRSGRWRQEKPCPWCRGWSTADWKRSWQNRKQIKFTNAITTSKQVQFVRYQLGLFLKDWFVCDNNFWHIIFKYSRFGSTQLKNMLSFPMLLWLLASDFKLGSEKAAQRKKLMANYLSLCKKKYAWIVYTYIL